MKMAEAKTDCFAYSKKTGQCMALNDTYCKHEETCAFYKTKEEHEADIKKYPIGGRGKQ